MSIYSRLIPESADLDDVETEVYDEYQKWGKMKYYATILGPLGGPSEEHPNGTGEVYIYSQKAILDMYFEEWSKKMRKVGKRSKIERFERE